MSYLINKFTKENQKLKDAFGDKFSRNSENSIEIYNSKYVPSWNDLIDKVEMDVIPKGYSVIYFGYDFMKGLTPFEIEEMVLNAKFKHIEEILNHP